MNKEQVLKILGDYVESYYIELISGKRWIVVEVKSLTAYHMAMLDRFILSIQPTDKKTMLVHFCSTIEIE